MVLIASCGIALKYVYMYVIFNSGAVMYLNYTYYDNVLQEVINYQNIQILRGTPPDPCSNNSIPNTDGNPLQKMLVMLLEFQDKA